VKKLTILLLLTVCKLSFAQGDQKSPRNAVLTINELIPHGWKLIAKARGDLNKDGLVDLALVIENTNRKNFISNAGGLGTDTLNTNPRGLLVAFKQPNGTYQLVTKNTSFIPPPNAPDSPCLLDPFGEEGSIEISKGLLKINFQHFYSCGGWETYNFEYIFRYQHQKFELIGYNKSSMNRASGEETQITVNFSTLKLNRTSGSNAFGRDSKPKTSWERFKLKKLFELSTIHQDSLDRFNF